MRILAGALLLSVSATNAASQWQDNVRPFASGAVLVGAQGFARPPITSAVTSGFVHLPINALLLGVQGGWTFAETERSHASYALATLAYPRQRAVGWQAYPFVGLGGASFRTDTVAARWKPAFGAGLGFDALLGQGGGVIALRVGYITRGLSDDASVAYAAMGVGLGSRRNAGEGSGTVAVRRRSAYEAGPHTMERSCIK
jgi:hypothetical protein